MKIEHALPSQRIRSATAKNHLTTEQLLGLTKNGSGALTPSQYLQLTRTNYFVWSALKDELELRKTNGWSRELILINTLVEAAAKDVSFPAGKKVHATIPYPEITDEYSLLGSLYVHLGSLLGGRIINGLLERNKDLLPFRPFHFYAAGASFTGGEWRSFVARLNDTLQAPEHLAAAVALANDVFNHYQRVYLASAE